MSSNQASKENRQFNKKNFVKDSLSDEEIELVIEEPKGFSGKKNQHSANKINDIEFLHDEGGDDDELTAYISINKEWLQTRMWGREKGKSSPLINHREPSPEAKMQSLYTREFKIRHFCYTFSLIKADRNTMIVEVEIKLRDTDNNHYAASLKVYSRAPYSSNWDMLLLPKTDKHQATTERVYWHVGNLSDRLRDDIFLQINLLYTEASQSQDTNFQEYCGLLNLGNTCYVNSFLQTVFHLKSLRKTIVEHAFDPRDRFGLQLQWVFSRMMTHRDATISPSLLIRYGPWGSRTDFRQEDVHEFKLTFFDSLQHLIPDIWKDFKGQMRSEVYCKDVDYKNSSVLDFDELDLYVTTTTRRVIPNIHEALINLTREEKLDQKLETDDFGKQEAFKRVQLIKLPKVLFFSLKRYEFDTFGLHKLLSRFEYQQNIDLSPFMEGDEKHEYTLYAVLVHAGKSSDEGHYYSYINVSKDLNTPNWYVFNDGTVRKARDKEVYEDNFGGLDKRYSFSSIEGGFRRNYVNRSATAYILVYIRNQNWDEIQNVEMVPSQIQEQKQDEEQIKDRSMEKELPSVAKIDDNHIRVHILTERDVIGSECSFFNVREMIPLGKAVVFNSQITIDENIANYLERQKQRIEKNKNGYSVWKIGSDKSVMNLRRLYKSVNVKSTVQSRPILTIDLLLGDSILQRQFYILLIPNTHLSCDQQEFRKLHDNNQHALVINYITFLNSSDQFVSKIEKVRVVTKSFANERNCFIQSEYDNTLILQRRKLDTLKDVRFAMKNMYCEIVQSYMTIDEGFYTDCKINKIKEEEFVMNGTFENDSDRIDENSREYRIEPDRRFYRNNDKRMHLDESKKGDDGWEKGDF